MKSEKKIIQMKDFISGFNDGEFMNQDFRKGLLTAFNYCLGFSTQTMDFIDKNYIKGKKK